MFATVAQPTVQGGAQTDGSSQKPKAVRINVTMSEGHYEELKELAAKAGIDMSEYVRTAIRLFSYLEIEKQNGKKVYVGNNDVLEKEIVLP